MARAARAMAMATKRVMATNGDNTGNGYSKEGGNDNGDKEGDGNQR